MKYDFGDLLIALSKTKEFGKVRCRVFLYLLSEMLSDKSKEGNNSQGIFFEEPHETQENLKINVDNYNDAVNFLVEHGLFFRSIDQNTKQTMWIQEPSSKWLLAELGPNITSVNENYTEKNNDIVLTVSGCDTIEELAKLFSTMPPELNKI